jgi:hypothetical protein
MFNSYATHYSSTCHYQLNKLLLVTEQYRLDVEL